MSEVARRDWLLKKGTREVFLRTPILAKRDDMLAIEEEEAHKLIAEIEAERVAKHAKPEVSKEEVEAKQTLEEKLASMTEPELKAKAFELKIAFRKNATIEGMREQLRRTISGDIETMANFNRKVLPAQEMPLPVLQPLAPDPV